MKATQDLPKTSDCDKTTVLNNFLSLVKVPNKQMSGL